MSVELMKATALALLAVSIAVFVILGTVEPASAQSPSISTGVVTEVETDNEGRLTAFSIVKGDGSVVRFAVSASNPNTSYGLENRVGERWVSDQAFGSSEKSATRLKDQQNRLTQISMSNLKVARRCRWSKPIPRMSTRTWVTSSPSSRSLGLASWGMSYSWAYDNAQWQAELERLREGYNEGSES